MQFFGLWGESAFQGRDGTVIVFDRRFQAAADLAEMSQQHCSPVIQFNPGIPYLFDVVSDVPLLPDESDRAQQGDQRGR